MSIDRVPECYVLSAIRARFDYPMLPAPLRRYVAAVALLGPTVAVALALASPAPEGLRRWFLMVILAALAGVAERYPLHLTHKTSVNVGTALYLAMVLLLPWQLPALLAAAAALVAHGSRAYQDPDLGLAEPLFNAGQAALYVAAGSVAAGALGALPWSQELSEAGGVPTLIVASVVMHLTNTGLVAVAAALQMGIAPFRVWWHNLALDLTPHVTLTVLGGIAANLADASPFFLPVLLVPGILVHRAVAQTVRLRIDTHEALASLVEVVELRDPYTAGHSRRVAQTARMLALRLGLTAEEADVIESAGRVHDIGKVAIDPAILAKPDNLSDGEWTQMRLHPGYGANVVERFAAYRDGAALVRHHHEAWDGSGYPDGLAGELIPFGARILAVADTFDALTSDRPYRDGMSMSNAMAVLSNGAGTQWDERVIDALVRQLADAPGDIPLFSRTELASTAYSVPARIEAA
jgi:HD-GYP domain-containing protein (c-di-GMP phosphodiesterase class II)